MAFILETTQGWNLPLLTFISALETDIFQTNTTSLEKAVLQFHNIPNITNPNV